MTSLKAFAANKSNAEKRIKLLLDSKENNIGEKQPMLVTSIFSLTHYVFNSLLSQGCQKSGLNVKG